MDKVYRFTAWAIVISLAIIGILRATAIRWWQVPLDDPELAASIMPGLEGGDWILLWRLTRPGLGDLVQCPDPDDPSNENVVVMGRVAGVSGDEIVIHGQKIVLNGKVPNNEYNCTQATFEYTDPDSLTEKTAGCEMEDIGERLHMRGFDASSKKRRGKFKKQVPPGHFFLLSDNRAAPFDSRHFGTIDRRTCKETVFFRLVSKNGFFDTKNRLTFVH